MQQVTLNSNVAKLIGSPSPSTANPQELVQSHFAYQTPPYEVNKVSYHISSPNIQLSSSLTLIEKITRLLSALTLDYCNSNSKINNSFTTIKPFVTEILKRSKSNKLIAILASHYFKTIFSNLQEKQQDELPEFAKCSKRIFLSCLILSHKFVNDNTFSMETWSSISGLKSKDLSTMERWCLNKLGYNLFIDSNKLLTSETTFFGQTTKSLKRKLDEDPFNTSRNFKKISKSQ